MKFYIQRKDGKWFVGTVDRQPVWVDDKAQAGAFRAKEHAERRIEGLPADTEYQIHR